MLPHRHLSNLNLWVSPRSPRRTSTTRRFGWQGLRSWLLRSPVLIGFVILSLLVGVVLQSPAVATQVRITPTTPRLGDTLSITIQPTTPTNLTQTPTVVVGDKSYPAFAIGTNLWRAFVPTTPLDRPGVRRIQVTADETRNLAIQIRNRSFPVQRIWLPPGKDNLTGSDAEFDRVDAFKQLVTPQKFWNGPFLQPNRGPITTGYGVRRYYNGKFAEDYYHRGVDYAGSHGSPVIAPAAGRVALVGFESKGFQIHGNTIGVDHGQGVASIFIHLSRINVKEGDFVKAGQVIGAVGSSGASTGPHLHWGLYVNGQAVDPYPWRTQRFE